MKFKTLMIIKAMVCITLGILILLVPKFFYGLFGLVLPGNSIFPTLEYGASLMGNAMLTGFARNVEESKIRHAITLGMTVYNAIGFIATLIFVIIGGINYLGWGPVGINLFFSLAFGYYYIKPPKP
jgi:hypothetical protein